MLLWNGLSWEANPFFRFLFQNHNPIVVYIAKFFMVSACAIGILFYPKQKQKKAEVVLKRLIYLYIIVIFSNILTSAFLFF